MTYKGNYSIKDLQEMEPEDKFAFAGSLLKKVCSLRPYTMAFSGGKDSTLMEVLAIDFGVSVPKVYNNTTIDPPGTIAYCLKHQCKIHRPKETFLQIVERKGIPSMFKRFCCKRLKEQYIADCLLVGIRRSESIKRGKNYTCFEDSYIYTKKLATTRFFPLLFFNDEDIEYFFAKYQIEAHPDYYDAFGHFCVDRRLGCIGCPLQGDRGKKDFLKYPKLLKQVVLSAIKFHEAHGRTKEDAYKNVVYNLFYSNHGYEKYSQAYEGLFETDAKQVLEEYFFINLP